MRKLCFKTFPYRVVTIRRKSNLIVELDKENGLEVVGKITDEWNAKAVYASVSDQPRWYLLPSQLIRRINTKWSLFYLPHTDTGNLIFDLFSRLWNLKSPVMSKENKALQDSLLPPEPKHVNK